MNPKYLSLIFIAFFSTIAIAQSKKENLESYFSALAKNRQFTGNVLVAEKGKVIYEKSFGYAIPSTKRLNTIETQFRIASITKTFTATAILQLKEKGKLQITDNVIKYLPNFPYPEITIKQLLSHTSGIPTQDDIFSSLLNYDSLMNNNKDTVLTNNDFINGMISAKRQLYFNPGEGFSYNNSNFIVLAILVQRISGLDIHTYVNKFILKPAGMKHTFFPIIPLSHFTKKEKENLALPFYLYHSYSDELVRSDTIPYLSKYDHICQFTGMVEMITTLHDLLNYDQALNNGKLLNYATLNEAYTPVKLTNGKDNTGMFGLGWQIDVIQKKVNHGGSMPGAYASFARNIEKNQTAIVFSISRGSLTLSVANNAIKILNGEEVTYPRKSIAIFYSKVLIKQGDKAAAEFLENAMKDTANYYLDEDELNFIGYDLIGKQFAFHLPVVNHYQEALQVFKLNTELFPQSWKAYDSYGEALLKNGNKAEAIKMYKKSIELNPNNKAAEKIIEGLLK